MRILLAVGTILFMTSCSKEEGSTPSTSTPTSTPTTNTTSDGSTTPAAFESPVTVVGIEDDMEAYFAAKPSKAAELPAISTLAGNWKGRVVSIDPGDGVPLPQDEWPEISFAIQGERMIPDPGFGSERALRAGAGEYLATASGLPDLHLRLDGDRLLGWIESAQEPKRRMEFNATRIR